MEEIALTLEELAEQVGVSARTIRFYITEGLLTGPEGRGKAAMYSEDHLLRLRLIRLLSERHMPLVEIRTLLAPLAVEEVRSLLAEQMQQQVQTQAISPRDYIGALLKQAQQVKERQEQYQPRSRSALPSAPSMATPQPLAPSMPSQESSLPDQHAVGKARKGEVEEQIAEVEEHEARGRQEMWTRWELAPGVELQVQTHVIGSYREAIRETIERFQMPHALEDTN